MQWTARMGSMALALGLAWSAVCPAPTPPRPRPVAEATPAVMADVERAAVKVVDGYWKRHFAELSTQAYRSPRVAGAYLNTGGPSCAGRPSIAFNAFYCRRGDFLAWDEQLMSLGYQKIGDSWVYLVIAHEWGHAIQARLRRNMTALSPELQADCLAGATLQGAANDGLVTIEPGDSEELRRTMVAAADNSPWTSRRDHGDAQQRISSFNTGVDRGVKACF